MTPACMTEESDSENAEKIVTHQLLWRSECEFYIILCIMCVCVYVWFRGEKREKVEGERWGRWRDRVNGVERESEIMIRIL